MALSNIASWTRGGKSSACGTAENRLLHAGLPRKYLPAVLPTR